MNQKTFELRLDIQSSYEGEYQVEVLKLIDAEAISLSLKCPHCEVFSSMNIDNSAKRFKGHNSPEIYFSSETYGDMTVYTTHPVDELVFDFICSCPSCKKTVFVQASSFIELIDYREVESSQISMTGYIRSIFPKNRIKVPSEVPEIYSKDFIEASLILEDSPKGSAALSRRILQNILHNEFNIQNRNLSLEIDAFMKLPNIPAHLADAVDAVRNIGNFAAHPLKSTSTGEVAEVEPGEAEWLIEVLNDLFYFTFVQPKRLEKRRKQLNQKLESLGKPPMKSSRREMEIERNGTDTDTDTDPKSVSGTAGDETSK